MFSPKALDRAFTMELAEVDLATYGTGSMTTTASGYALHHLPGVLVPKAPTSDDWIRFGSVLEGVLRDTVVELHRVLREEHRHFGYRVANEIARFVNLASQQAGTEPESLWIALDLAILQKVLPKFHGTQHELQASLRALLEFAATGSRHDPPSEMVGVDRWRLVGTKLEWADSREDAIRLPRTAGKVYRMLRRLDSQGFTSFIE
jgi:5-methylcytosine-specific restriction enzyme B